MKSRPDQFDLQCQYSNITCAGCGHSLKLFHLADTLGLEKWHPLHETIVMSYLK